MYYWFFFIEYYTKLLEIASEKIILFMFYGCLVYCYNAFYGIKEQNLEDSCIFINFTKMMDLQRAACPMCQFSRSLSFFIN